MFWFSSPGFQDRTGPGFLGCYFIHILSSTILETQTLSPKVMSFSHGTRQAREEET